MGETILSDWTTRLTTAVADGIREFAPTLGESAVVILAVDCHPWHGLIDLATLTAEDVAADPALATPAEMAAWPHYRFSARLTAWQPLAILGAEMRAAYMAAADPSSVAVEFMRACARAALAPRVAAATKLLKQAAGFRFSVTHPDDGREFVEYGGPVTYPNS